MAIDRKQAYPEVDIRIVKGDRQVIPVTFKDADNATVNVSSRFYSAGSGTVDFDIDMTGAAAGEIRIIITAEDSEALEDGMHWQLKERLIEDGEPRTRLGGECWVTENTYVGT
jgi:hypothetical protein